MTGTPRQRLRLRYRKDEVLMYISHRDLLRFLFKLLRRAEIPYATTGRFSPKPRVTFAPALPLGVRADAELADIELAGGVTWDSMQILDTAKALAAAAHPRDFVAGLSTLVPGCSTLGKQIHSASYELRYAQDCDMAPVAEHLLADTLPFTEKHGKVQDLKPAVIDYSIDGPLLTVTGAVNPQSILNITRLASILAESTGSTPELIIRRCFLDNRYREL